MTYYLFLVFAQQFLWIYQFYMRFFQYWHWFRWFRFFVSNCRNREFTHIIRWKVHKLRRFYQFSIIRGRLNEGSEHWVIDRFLPWFRPCFNSHYLSRCLAFKGLSCQFIPQNQHFVVRYDLWLVKFVEWVADLELYAITFHEFFNRTSNCNVQQLIFCRWTRLQCRGQFFYLIYWFGTLYYRLFYFLDSVEGVYKTVILKCLRFVVFHEVFPAFILIYHVKANHLQYFHYLTKLLQL